MMSRIFFQPCKFGAWEAARASAAGVGRAGCAGAFPSVTGPGGGLFGTFGGLDGEAAAVGPSVTGALGAAAGVAGCGAGCPGGTTAGCASAGAAGAAGGGAPPLGRGAKT